MEMNSFVYISLLLLDMILKIEKNIFRVFYRNLVVFTELTEQLSQFSSVNLNSGKISVSAAPVILVEKQDRQMLE